MPGKSQASNRSKPDSSRERMGSEKSNESAKKVCIWPVWSDSEIEKQEQGVSGKGRDKAKLSHAPPYEDPEGVLLPPTLSAMGDVSWKRPFDLPTITALSIEEVCVVNDLECTSMELLSNNKHILHSKFVSWLVSEVSALWRARESLSPAASEEQPPWAPWSHIYPHNKNALAHSFGKYFVKLFWMGSWRKVTVDDHLPFLIREASSEEVTGSAIKYQSLYPRTAIPGEIWPALLMKALLKVAALDSMGAEFGDFSVTQLLTGWAPQAVAVEPDKRDSIWHNFLLPSLPLWVRDCDKNERVVGKRCLVYASFRIPEEQQLTKKASVFSNTESMIETILKEAGIFPSTFDQTTSPVFPLLLTQARDEPLVPPPNTPPPPVLQFPCYLGLINRQRNPSMDTPPSTPPPDNPWFLEVAPREVDVIVKEEEEESESESERDAVWISYSEFLKCFSHLYIFKSPSSFEHKDSYVDLTKTVQEQNMWSQVKKAASSVQLLSTTKALTSTENNVLFVDSPQPILLHFVLSSLSSWREGGRNTHTVPLKSPFPKSPGRETLLASRLVVDTFQWSSVQASAPLLRLKTTGTKGATFSLPPGRHVLKLHAKSPIAYHLTVLSNAEFQLTDEDNIYTFLSKESSLYTSFCSEFMDSLVKSAKHLGSSVDLKASLRPLVMQMSSVGLTAQHSMLFLASVLEVWFAHGKEYGLTNAMRFAWKSFFYKSFALLEKELPRSGGVGNIQQMRRSLNNKRSLLENKSSSDESGATVQEYKAASQITRCLQQHINTRRRKFMTPGTQGNKVAIVEIENSLSSLEPHLNSLAMEVLSGVFKLDPSLEPLFPFHTDESERCFSTLYNGHFPPLPPNAWALVLRAVFRVPTSQTIVPRFSSPVPAYLLRVINNDTMTELPRVFHYTTPVMYTPNTHGYTVQVEAWCGDSEGVEAAGKWGLRLVCSNQDQPVLAEEELVTPHTREIIEYCLPDRDNVLLRYTLSPTKDLPVSVHLRMSKPDAFCKLQLLDDEVPVCEVEGRRVCVIPLYCLQENKEEEKPHKYVVQAIVLRDSWPTSETAWSHSAMIRGSDKPLEDKPDNKPSSAKKGRSKGAASKKGNTPSVAQNTSTVDVNKPHWILRVATNAADKDNLMVAKDTEKADALRAMVQAWETEEPGRSKKAIDSRKKFLEARGIKEDQPANGGQAPNGPVKIQQMDLSPFIINDGPPRLLDESEQELRVADRQKLFKDYRTERQSILQKRNDDREVRNEAKLRQLQQAETWQCDLDTLRNKVNSGREAIRERHLKKEKAKLEAEQASQVEKPPSAATGRDSKAAKAKSGKGKKK